MARCAHDAPVAEGLPPLGEPRCTACGHRLAVLLDAPGGMTLWACPVPARSHPAWTWPGELLGRLLARRAKGGSRDR